MILQMPPYFSSFCVTYYYKLFQSFFSLYTYIATPFMTSGMSCSSLFSLLKLLVPFTSALTSIENDE